MWHMTSVYMYQHGKRRSFTISVSSCPGPCVSRGTPNLDSDNTLSCLSEYLPLHPVLSTYTVTYTLYTCWDCIIYCENFVALRLYAFCCLPVLLNNQTLVTYANVFRYRVYCTYCFRDSFVYLYMGHVRCSYFTVRFSQELISRIVYHGAVVQWFLLVL